MSCIERIEIEEFVKGKLAPQRMLAVDSHIRECSDCKKLATSLSSRVDLAASVTGAVDCPEYEELSAYVDESLDAARSAAVRNHANLCEFCAGDLDRIRELRAHATLRESVTVTPGTSRIQRRGFFVYWRHAVAIASAAVVVAVAFTFGSFEQSTPKGRQHTALNPPINNGVRIAAPQNPPKTEPEKIAVNTPPVVPEKVAVNPTKPAPIVTAPVLRDGRYSVVRKGGTLTLAKAGGGSVGSRLDARMAAKISEKLSTGRIKLPEPIKMAVATFTMRSDGDEYHAPPAAPKPASPIGKIVMSATPTFSWSEVDLADSYRVQVYDESGHIVAEQLTHGTSLAFPKPLARGKSYTWRVAVRFGEEDSWTRSGSNTFYVLSEQDFGSINSVRKNLRGSHLAMGAAYESAGLYDEAANEYRLLRRANPKSQLAKDLLYGVSHR